MLLPISPDPWTGQEILPEFEIFMKTIQDGSSCHTSRFMDIIKPQEQQKANVK